MASLSTTLATAGKTARYDRDWFVAITDATSEHAALRLPATLKQVDVLQLVDEASNATALVERTWFSSRVLLLVDGTWRGGSTGRKMASLAVFQVCFKPDASEANAVDAERDATRCHDDRLLPSIAGQHGHGCTAHFSQHAACCPSPHPAATCHPLPVWLPQELMH
jgi:hypothetical protein